MVESRGWNLLRLGGSVERHEAVEGDDQENRKRKVNDRERDFSMIRLGMTELHSSIKNGCLT